MPFQVYTRIEWNRDSGLCYRLSKPTQIPVTDSDHTRGMAFDAAVMIPRLKKRRVSVDYLARLAGLMRPDFRRDPVHFKPVAVSVARAQGE